MKIRQWLLVAALPLWFGCKSSTPPASAARPTASDPRSSPIATNIGPYLRIAHPTTNLAELQVAIRQFVPRDRSQTAVWLVGVSHPSILDRRYFVDSAARSASSLRPLRMEHQSL